MTPKEKAKELVDKFFRNDFLHHDISYQQAEECALIAVDEILDELDHIPASNETREYWEKVKQEIEKL